jgi:hypothetical protein
MPLLVEGWFNGGASRADALNFPGNIHRIRKGAAYCAYMN